MSVSDELDAYLEFRAAWERARQGSVRLLTPLPRRVRFRLWWHGRVDGACCRFVEAGHDRVAVAVWRVFGMWR